MWKYQVYEAGLSSQEMKKKVLKLLERVNLTDKLIENPQNFQVVKDRELPLQKL